MENQPFQSKFMLKTSSSGIYFISGDRSFKFEARENMKRYQGTCISIGIIIIYVLFDPFSTQALILIPLQITRTLLITSAFKLDMVLSKALDVATYTEACKPV